MSKKHARQQDLEVISLLDSDDDQAAPAHTAAAHPSSAPVRKSSQHVKKHAEPIRKKARTSKHTPDEESSEDELPSSQPSTVKPQLKLTTVRQPLTFSFSHPSQTAKPSTATSSSAAAPKPKPPIQAKGRQAQGLVHEPGSHSLTAWLGQAPAGIQQSGATPQRIDLLSKQQAGTGIGVAAECWLDKHAPRTSDDLCLAVARKKVAELRTWLESWLPANKRHPPCTPRMLVLTGPAGCGKSTAVAVLAAELGYQLVEWAPEAPTLWSEAVYQKLPWSGEAGSTYTSKLDEFAAFVARAKYPALALSMPQATQPHAPSQQPAGTSNQSSTQTHQQNNQGQTHTSATVQAPKLLVLDDLPHVHGASKRAEMASLLRDLACTSRCPVLLIVTETTRMAAGGAGSTGMSAAQSDAGLHKDVQAALQAAGAGMLGFNPITDTNTSKVLLHISEAEGQPLSAEAAAGLAKMAGGDLRNAVHSLQLMFGNSAATPVAPAVTKGGRKGKGGSASSAAKSRGVRGAAGAGKQLLPHEAARLPAVQRDMGLQLFHALGKILYNKRDAQSDDEGQEGQLQSRGSLSSKQKQGVHQSLASQQVASSTHHRPLHSRELHGQQASAEVTGALGRERASAGGLHGLPSFAYTEELLNASQRRPVMHYDPEAIIMHAGLEPLPLVAFLHANYLQFVGEDETDDASEAAAYLSDAAFLCCHRTSTSGGYQGYWGEEVSTAASLTAACASSVAARGLLFTNQHPPPRRFTAMQGSVHTQVDKAAAANMLSLAAAGEQLVLRHSATAAGSARAMAMQVMPYLRALVKHEGYDWLQRMLPSSWSYFYNGKITEHRQHPGRSSGAAEQLALDLGDASLIDAQQDDPIEQGD